MSSPHTTLVLHSGGLDSTVCLLLAKEKGYNVVSLGIDYGQRHKIELSYARKQCRKFKVPRRVIKVEWTKPDRTIPENRTLEDMRASVSPAFLPGRNAIFLTIGAAEAAGIRAEELWVGVNCVDYSGYPDCRPDFIKAFKSMLALAIPNGPRVVTPLLTMPKPEIAREAARLGLRYGDTWSCYRPVSAPAGPQPCEKCDACILHKAAWGIEPA
jgi:7-cyano-7-deazaguanine synthase